MTHYGRCVFNPQEAGQVCDVRGSNSHTKDKFGLFLLGYWPLFPLCKEGDYPKAGTCRERSKLAYTKKPC